MARRNPNARPSGWNFREAAALGKAAQLRAQLAKGWLTCRMASADRKKHTKVYAMWNNMKARAGKKRYWLHVSVCAEWQDYAPFRQWACAQMRETVHDRKSLSLDRINPYGNYTPENCRLIPRGDNTRRAVMKHKYGIVDL